MYVVKFDDWWEQTAWYYERKDLALYRFNQQLEDFNLVNVNGDKIPCRVEDWECWWSIEKVSFDDKDTQNEIIIKQDLLLKQQRND